MSPPPAAAVIGQYRRRVSHGQRVVLPVGWRFNPEHDTIDVGGNLLERSKRYPDVAHAGRAAIVIDDVLPPWKPRGAEVRGRAEVLGHPTPLIRIHPERIVSWGVESDREAR
jgi:pyridoxamine 5'-phosphate oxidase family protein